MWNRALAFLIDFTLFAIVAFIEKILNIQEEPLTGLMNLLIVLSYMTGMNYYFGGTLGKRIVGLRVALPNSPDVFGQLVLRAFIKLICCVPPMSTVYALIAVWRSDGRSIADFASGSTVVEALTFKHPPQISISGKICATVLILTYPFLFLFFVSAFFMGWMFLELFQM